MERKASAPGEMARALGARARYESARGAGSQVLNMLERAEAVARALGDWPEVDRTLAVLATRTAFAGDLDRALAKIADLLDPSRPHGRGSQVDGYQALAVVRQAQGAVAAALDARRRAISAAKSQGYQEREANLTTNLGFALSALGAREEARSALCRGFALADSIGSSAAIRHAQMNLLGFAALYGTDRELDALLGETRSQAESDADSIWLSGDRANLGILYYRGVELLHRGSRATLPKACALLERACREYRVQLHQDVLPVALGQWAEAERRLGRLESSRNLAVEGAMLLQAGAPSLLNEAPLYLALYRVESDLGEAVRAEQALRSGMQPLMRRFQTLAGSPYARTFLTGLLENADLIAAASAAGLLPASLAEALS
jgi:eukaryotic-like serine/threonine-protein kinase